MMYPSNFRNYLTFSMLSNQSTNRMAANNGHTKMIICKVWMIFQCEMLDICNKNVWCGS